MASYLHDTIIPTIATAVELITPDVLPNIRFKRWRGAQPIEQVEAPQRSRAFAFRLGASKTPRSMSSFSTLWLRHDLILVVGYNFTEPLQTDWNGVGAQRMAMADTRHLNRVLMFSHVLSGLNALSLQVTSTDAPGPKSVAWHLDLEWKESAS